MKNSWRVEKRDVWAFPPLRMFEEWEDVYGIRIENTGLAYIVASPELESKSQMFVWAESVDKSEFDQRTEEEWAELLEILLEDENSDLWFSLRAFVMNNNPAWIAREALHTARGDLKLLERCVNASLELDEQFLHFGQLHYGRIGGNVHLNLRVNDDGFFDVAFLSSSRFGVPPKVPERASLIAELFQPKKNRDKIARYCALRQWDESVGEAPYELPFNFAPVSVSLSAHEELERLLELRDLLTPHFSPDEVNALIQHISLSR